MVTGGAVCSNWACTESVRGEVSDGLPYLDQQVSRYRPGKWIMKPRVLPITRLRITA